MAGLVAVALFLAAGLGLTALLPPLSRLPWGRRAAYAYLLGVAWVAGLLYALSHWAGAPPGRWSAVLAALVPMVGGGVAAWRRRRRGLGPAHRKRRLTLLEKLAVGLGAMVSLALFAEAVTDPLRDWDGRMTWAASARYVRADGSVDARVFVEPGWYVTHEWYPLLLPVAQVAAMELVEADSDHHVFRPLYAAFFPVLLLLIHHGGRRLAGRSGGALAAMAVAVLPFVFYPGGGANSAYSDIPLACFYGGALLLLAGSRLRLAHGLAAGLLLAAVALTKNEGAPLAVWALLAVGIAPVSRRAVRRKGAALAAAAAVVAPALILLVSWRAGIPGRFASYQRLISWDNLWPGLLERIPFLLIRARWEMVLWEHWGLFWSMFVVALVAGWRGLRHRSALLLTLAAAGPLGIAWVGYTVSLDPGFLVHTSWSRLLVQAGVPLLGLFAMAAEDVVQNLTRSPVSRRTPPPLPGGAAGWVGRGESGR